MPAIKAMLARSINVNTLSDYINDENWWIEQKLDGERVLMHVIDSTPFAINRNGVPYTRPVPASVLEVFRSESWVGRWVLDGELLDGIYHVFDIPFVAPRDTILVDDATPYSSRRLLLEKLFERLDCAAVKLVETAKTPEEKAAIIELVRKANGEGLMVKHKDGTYRQGNRSTMMLKAKFTATLEAFITEIGRNGKRSIAVGLYDADMKEIDVGTIPMSDRNLARASLNDVVEVRYLYCGRGYRLYQPAFIRYRSDKTPSECRTGQLKMVNKEVIVRSRSD